MASGERYTGCMIGSHGFVSIAEAVLKGQRSKVNRSFLYERMRDTVMTGGAHSTSRHGVLSTTNSASFPWMWMRMAHR